MAYCFLAIIVFRYQRDNHTLSDKACRALGAVALLISIGLMAHVLLEFGHEPEPNEGNPSACPEQLTGWVFANALISCLALLNIPVNSYRKEKDLIQEVSEALDVMAEKEDFNQIREEVLTQNKEILEWVNEGKTPKGLGY